MDDEEQPIAIAFSDTTWDAVHEELVYDDDIFWGTIYINHGPSSTRLLTTRNNRRIEAVLERLLGLLPQSLRLLIAHLVHYHY
jgi:hypothetical protein